MSKQVETTRECVVFSTPGKIPLQSFTMFGLNAKPESKNPFGFFGTGLKIAIAVCLRMQQEVVIWRGLDKYTFYTKKTDFRGKEFQTVRMKKETWSFMNRIFLRPSYMDLPFTTELGKHWELWQAFREFETNTMDENGSTAVEYWAADSKHVHENRTCIVVYGARFLDEFYDRSKNFLEGGLSERTSDESIQVLNKPSKHVYYRGVRVWDLKEESIYTYNFLRSIDLTEDRTAKHPFMLESWIAEYIMQSDDPAFLQRTVVAPRAATFERNLSYNYVSALPSASFVGAARESPNVRAKELVKVAEERKAYTVARINIPEEVSEEGKVALREAVLEQWPNATIFFDNDSRVVDF